MTNHQPPTNYTPGPYGHAYWLDTGGDLMACPMNADETLDLNSTGYVVDWDEPLSPTAVAVIRTALAER